MKNKTNLKSITCAIMSAAITFSPLGTNTTKIKANEPSIFEAIDKGENLRKIQLSKLAEELVNIYEILLGKNKYPDFKSLTPDQQELFKNFYETIMNGNKYQLKDKPDVEMGIFGTMKGIDKIDKKQDPFIKILTQAMPNTFQKKVKVDYADIMVLVFPSEYKQFIYPYAPANRDAEMLNIGICPGTIDKYYTPTEYETLFYETLFTNTRTQIITSIETRLPALKKELEGTYGGVFRTLKGIVFNPIFLIFASFLLIKFGGDAIGVICNLATEFSNIVKNVYYKVSHKGFDLSNYQECLDRIEKRLREELVGQDEAIDKVIDVMRGYFQSIIETKESNEKFEGGLMLYLTGSPATGKSTMMKIIQEEMALRNFSAKMSDVIEDKNNGAKTVAARLTKPTVQKAKFRDITIQTPLMMQLEQHHSTLYAFDEIDKMRKLDEQLAGGKKEQNGINSIDELLRNFIDTGHIAGVDASGSIVIATSNETDEDMAKLDHSLRNRYSPYRVKFKDFNEDDYKEIIRRGSVEMQKYYKNKFNTEVEWSTEAIDYFAKKFVEEKTGGRCAEPLMMQVRSAITVLRTNNNDIKDKTLCIKVTNDENKKLFVDIAK